MSALLMALSVVGLLAVPVFMASCIERVNRETERDLRIAAKHRRTTARARSERERLR